MNRILILSIAVLLFGVLSPAAIAGAASVDPLNLPLVQSTNFSLTFLGSFKVPQGSGNGLFAYGGGAMSVNGTAMYMTGIYYYNNGASDAGAIGEINIPVLSGAPAYNGANGTATVALEPVIPGGGSGPPTLNCGQAASRTSCVFQGSVIYQGKLYVTVAPYYDAANGANGFLVGAGENLSGWGSVNAASAPCLSGTPIKCTQRYFAGVLGVVPAVWQSYLGGPCYEANGPGLAIESNAINGFGFSTFDCAAYSSGGGTIPVSESLDYYYGGLNPREPSIYSLTYRNFSGPFPLSGGGGCSETLSAAPTNGVVSVAFSAGFSGCDSPAGDGPFQITFSDGESRLVHLTDGSVDVPDNLYSCSYGVTGCSSFPALKNCPAGGCSRSVTVNRMGDNYFSEYDGPIGYAFIVPGSRSLLYISLHQFGPYEARGTGCNLNASGTNDAPLAPDTAHYRRLQITAYDLDELYKVHEGKIPVYSVSPYAFWSFPNWQLAANAVNDCLHLPGAGSFFFDPETNILYGTFSSNTYGYGNMIVDEWRVNPLTPLPNSPANVQVN